MIHQESISSIELLIQKYQETLRMAEHAVREAAKRRQEVVDFLANLEPASQPKTQLEFIHQDFPVKIILNIT